jgi:hypothetical protein
MSDTLDLGSNLDAEADVTVVKRGRPAKVKTAETAPAGAIVPGKRVRIVLEENDNIPPTGQFIGHNGKAYVLRPGEEAEVPAELLNVLNDAVEDRPIIGPDARVVGFKKALRLPYRRVHTVE